MRNFIAIAAALAINLGLVFAFQHSAEEALPKGEVTITELALEPLPTLAHAVASETRPATL